MLEAIYLAVQIGFGFGVYLNRKSHGMDTGTMVLTTVLMPVVVGMYLANRMTND